MLSHRRLGVLLFGVPFALILFASWQQASVEEHFLPLPVSTKQVDQSLPDLAKSSIKDALPDSAVLRLRTAQASDRPAEARRVAPDQSGAWDNIARFNGLLVTLTRITAISGIMAMLFGASGLYLIRRAGGRAMRSRDALIAGFDSTRRALPFVLSGVTIGIAIALASVLGFEALRFFRNGMPMNGTPRLAIALAIADVAVLFMIVRLLSVLPQAFLLFNPEPRPLLAREVSRKDGAALWEWIEALAARVGTAAPGTIVAGVSEGFFVTSGAVQLKPESRLSAGTVLHLALPLMALLDRSETEAIIAHELGHFSGADTEYTRRFSPIFSGISRTLDTLDQAGSARVQLANVLMWPAYELGTVCMESFHVAVMHWSRIREFEADAIGAAIAGTHPSVTALVRSLAADGPIEAVHASIRRDPAMAPVDLIVAVRAIAARDGFADPTDHLEVRQAHPTDSHPPTSERSLAMAEELPLRDTLRDVALRPIPTGEPFWFEHLFADLSTFSVAATRDYVESVAKQEGSIDQHLSAIANAFHEPRELVERTWWSVSQFVVLSLVAISFGIAIIDANGPPASMFYAAIALSAGAASATTALHFWRRSRSPFLRLASDGLQLHGATNVIPWTDVEEIGHHATNNGITVNFLLADGKAPTLDNTHFRRVKYDTSRQVLSVGVKGVKSLSGTAYVELVEEYYRAALARALLSEREAGRVHSDGGGDKGQVRVERSTNAPI